MRQCDCNICRNAKNFHKVKVKENNTEEPNWMIVSVTHMKHMDKSIYSDGGRIG